jgi:regulator of cell morphogenesis and NO signaling
LSAIDSTATLGSLVAERSARASLFERLHLDYCCGGAQTLAEACAKRGLDVETVRTVLEALDADTRDRRSFEEADWRRVSLEELCAHIVAIHHDGLRSELPRIDELLSRTVRVHASSHPELRDLQRSFTTIRARLEPHLRSEEEALFPACVALERSGEAIEDGLIDAHEHDHQDAGESLAALRELTDDYDTGRALCGTHRALVEALAALERGLHQHIHEENNVLLVRARRLNERAHPAPAERAGKDE